MRVGPTNVPERPLLHATLLGLLAAPIGCALTGGYDFDGYRAEFVGAPNSIDAGGAGDARTGVGSCLPITCDELGAECGTVPDGCVGTIQCGQCASPTTCGGGGISKKCGCTPITCIELAATCGVIMDGCGGTVDCGTCPGAQVCGQGGAHRCGCRPSTCDALNANCGMIPDGCDGILDCKSCAAGMVRSEEHTSELQSRVDI